MPGLAKFKCSMRLMDEMLQLHGCEPGIMIKSNLPPDSRVVAVRGERDVIGPMDWVWVYVESGAFAERDFASADQIPEVEVIMTRTLVT